MSSPRPSAMPGTVDARPRLSFSVVVAAYNCSETIAESLASAFEQTAPPAEVIVCDDGSTDDLAAALEPFEDQIVLLRQENRGAAAARNTASRAARGEFVVILDADDVFDARRLEALSALARDCPELDILTTDAYLVVQGRRVGTFYGERRFEPTDQRRAILQWCFVGGWPAVRRERLLELGGFDESLKQAHDWDCWLRLIFSGSRAGLIDEPLMEYRLTESNLSSDRAASLEDRVLLLQKAAREQNLSDEERGVLRDSLELHRSRAVVARALHGVDLTDADDVRRRTSPLIRDRTLSVRLRLRAAAAWLYPPRAGRWLGEAQPLATRLLAKSSRRS